MTAGLLALLVCAAGVIAAAPAQAATVYAWGENRDGQLGIGTLGMSSVPVAVSGVEAAGVSAGGRNSLALLPSGEVAGWGTNGNGELGNEETFTAAPEPVLASGLSEVKQVAAGHKFSLALLSDGTVEAWGNNKYGQLGTGNMEFASSPQPVVGLSHVKQIAAGFFHSLAVLENGTVEAWGNGFYGNLGDGTTEGSDVPKPIPGLSNVVEVSAGCIHSLALLSDGSVVSFGGNEYAQLGHGAKITKRTDVPEPVIGLPHEVVAIDAGLFYSLALMKNGTVMAWGFNKTGQLGNGQSGTTINGTPTTVSGLTEVVAVSAAAGSMSPARTSEHSLALTKSGAVYGWGGNEFGQVGNGTVSEGVLTPVAVSGLTSGVKAISSGGFHSLALK